MITLEEYFKDKVYEEKRRFVEALSEAFSMMDNHKDLTYRCFAGKFIEIVRARYNIGPNRCINVTGDSLLGIAKDIDGLFTGDASDAEVVDDKLLGLIEEWLEKEE